MEIGIAGLAVQRDDAALLVRSVSPLHILSSAVAGGGFMQARVIINRHVPKAYHCSNPVEDLQMFAATRGIVEPFVGLLTAVKMQDARCALLRDDGLTVAALVTAGLSNATAVGLTLPHRYVPGTVNTILLVDAHLSPAALVNTVMVATEAKTATLLAHGVATADGYPATGTSTDALVVACTGRGEPRVYAGPATRLGWLVGRAVRQALGEALA